MKNLQFWANFQIYIEKSQWKTDFYPFALPSSRTLAILYTSGTYKNFLGWFGGSSTGLGRVLSILERVLGVYKPLIRAQCIILTSNVFPYPVSSRKINGLKLYPEMKCSA